MKEEELLNTEGAEPGGLKHSYLLQSQRGTLLQLPGSSLRKQSRESRFNKVAAGGEIRTGKEKNKEQV